MLDYFGTDREVPENVPIQCTKSGCQNTSRLIWREVLGKYICVDKELGWEYVQGLGWRCSDHTEN